MWLEADALYPFESQGLGEQFHSSIDELRESIWIAIPMHSSKIACQVINNGKMALKATNSGSAKTSPPKPPAKVVSTMRNYVVIYAPCQNLVTTGINITVEDDPLTAVDTTQNGGFTRLGA